MNREIWMSSSAKFTIPQSYCTASLEADKSNAFLTGDRHNFIFHRELLRFSSITQQLWVEHWPFWPLAIGHWRFFLQYEHRRNIQTYQSKRQLHGLTLNKNLNYEFHLALDSFCAWYFHQPGQKNYFDMNNRSIFYHHCDGFHFVPGEDPMVKPRIHKTFDSGKVLNSELLYFYANCFLNHVTWCPLAFEPLNILLFWLHALKRKGLNRERIFTVWQLGEDWLKVKG